MIYLCMRLIRTYWRRMMSMWLVFSIVVVIITLVDQVIINIDRQIDLQTKPLVWADLIIESSQAFTWDALDKITTLLNGFVDRQLFYVEFYSTVGNASDPKLVQVQWVEDGYPLYGELIVEMLDSKEIVVNPTISGGTFIDEQTYALIGESTWVVLGDIVVPIQWIIRSAPTPWINVFDEWRRVVMPYVLVWDTNLTSFGSRVEYELQIALLDESQAPFLEELIEQEFGETYDVRTARDRIEQLGWLVEQLDQYSSIVLVCTILLSLMIMATAVSTMTFSISQTIAIARVLGLTRARVSAVLLLMYASMFVIGLVWWLWWAYYVFTIVAGLPIAAWFTWSSEVIPVVIGISCISFVVVCWRPLSDLITTHPLALLRSTNQTWDTVSRMFLTVLVIGLCMILWLLTGSLSFTLIVSWCAVLWIGWWYWIMMKIFRYWFTMLKPLRSRYFGRFDAVRQMIIPGNQTWLLVWWLTVSLMSFCIIIALSVSFLDRLRISSIDQPNLFVLNVRTQDVERIQSIDPQARLYDTILWRIESINTISLSDYIQTLPQWQRGWLTREFNITTVSLDNSPLVRWSSLVSGWISLDESFARELDVQLWDRISLLIQGRSFDLEIVSLRKSVRTGTEPFFYMQLDEEQFEAAPRSWFWITRQETDQLVWFKQLALREIGPHLSFVDVASIIELVTEISYAIIVVIILCVGIIVLLLLCVSVASNEASALLSRQWYRLYYILWMRQSDLLRKAWRIACLYGVMIILFVSLGTTLILWYVYSQASILTWSWSALWPMLWGSVATIAVMVLSYWLFHRAIIKKI